MQMCAKLHIKRRNISQIHFLKQKTEKWILFKKFPTLKIRWFLNKVCLKENKFDMCMTTGIWSLFEVFFIHPKKGFRVHNHGGGDEKEKRSNQKFGNDHSIMGEKDCFILNFISPKRLEHTYLMYNTHTFSFISTDNMHNNLYINRR